MNRQSSTAGNLVNIADSITEPFCKIDDARREAARRSQTRSFVPPSVATSLADTSTPTRRGTASPLNGLTDRGHGVRCSRLRGARSDGSICYTAIHASVDHAHRREDTEAEARVDTVNTKAIHPNHKPQRCKARVAAQDATGRLDEQRRGVSRRAPRHNPLPVSLPRRAVGPDSPKSSEQHDRTARNNSGSRPVHPAQGGSGRR